MYTWVPCAFVLYDIEAAAGDRPRATGDSAEENDIHENRLRRQHWKLFPKLMSGRKAFAYGVCVCVYVLVRDKTMAICNGQLVFTWQRRTEILLPDTDARP